jgi:hypothetical protein
MVTRHPKNRGSKALNGRRNTFDASNDRILTFRRFGLRADVTGRRCLNKINERAYFRAFIICPEGEKYFTALALIWRVGL